MTKISVLIHSNRGTSLCTGRCVRSANEIPEVVANRVFMILKNNLSTAEKKLTKEIADYKRCPVIYLAATGTIKAGISASLSLTVQQVATTLIQHPQLQVDDLGFAAPNEKVTNSTATDDVSLLLRSVTMKHVSHLTQQDLQVGKLKNKPASLKDWQSMVNFSLVDTKILKEDTMKMSSKRKDLLRKCNL